jgi:hypothetical protein
VLLVFEGLSEVAKLLGGHHVAQRGENNGVFACLMGLIHPDERRHVVHQGCSRRLIGRSRCSGGSADPVGERAAALMLGRATRSYPSHSLLLLSRRTDVMSDMVNRKPTTMLMLAITAVITGLNIYLLYTTLTGRS